jgi:hypothetical protein
MFGVEVDGHRDAINLEVIWEVVLVVRMAVHVNDCLERCYGSRVLGRSNGPEEYTGPVSRGKVHVLLSLQTKVEKVTFTKFEDSSFP